MNDWTPPRIVGVGIQTPDSGRPDGSTDAPWTLELNNNVLSLIRPDGVKLCVDFVAGKTRHRTREAGYGAGVLSKALGVASFRKRHGRYPAVIDGTGGWGQDAWAIASTGCTVTIVEQHGVVHALLANGLARALSDDDVTDTAARIVLIHNDAVETLSGAGTEFNADTIYLDPMYPVRERKKADSKKAMQFLHALLGPSDESISESLLAAALKNAAERVVVKRPKGAEPLLVPEGWSGQRTSVASPNTRYDIYLTR